MAERLNLNVSAISTGPKESGAAQRRPRPIQRPKTFARLVQFIEGKHYDPEVTKGLIAKATKIPCGAYDFFVSHINEYVAEIMKKRSQTL